MSTLSAVGRLLMMVLKHPATQAVLKHAIRVATAELVRHVRRHTASTGHHSWA